MAKKFKKRDFLKGRKEYQEKEGEIVEVKSAPKEEVVEVKQEKKPVVEHHKTTAKPKNIKEFYETKYKLLLLIPIILLIGAILQISFQTVTTGDFVKKGISLSGGVSLSVTTDDIIDIPALENQIRNIYSDQDVNIRQLTDLGKSTGFTIEIDIDGSDNDNVNKFIDDVNKVYTLEKDNYSLEVMGSSLGQSFFKETLKILFAAFLGMAWVVFLLFGHELNLKIYSGILTFIIAVFVVFMQNAFLEYIAYIIGIGLIIMYYRKSMPSIAVILAAFSDIIITLAVFNILGFKLSTAGVAAFLMLIGYSVDTDILLSTKVLKSKHGTASLRIYEAMKTGIMMNLTTVVAIILGLIFAKAETIKQIMTILLIGLLVDLINTWIQNVSLLRIHLENKGKSQ